MSKKISIENYSRKRGLIAHTVKMRLTTASSKLAHEYFELLKKGSENSIDGVQEYLKRCEELKNMKKQY